MPEPEAERPPMRTQPRPRRKGWRLLGRALLGALALLVVALLGAVIWLHTGAGERSVAGIVVSQVKGAIRGDLRLGSVQVGGFLHVCVDGIELRDPEQH